MKLRIQGDSLRLRMTRNEVAFLHNFGCVESTIRFAPGRVLSYSVTSSTDAAELSVHYEDDSICVVLPQPVVMAWAAGTQVTIEGNGSPAWIRTTIHGSKGRCPTIRRPGIFCKECC
jgi:hypothetical protein